MSFLLTAIIFVLLLGGLIMAHETGHFAVARLFKMRIEEFSIGFPPRLFSRQGSNTRYTIGAIPLGGFVRLYGEQEGNDHDSFQQQPIYRRALVTVAGITANIVVAFLLLFFSFSIGAPSVVTPTTSGQVSNSQLVIVEVLPNSPALRAGLQLGDQIVRLNEQTVRTPQNLQTALTTATASITIKRGAEEKILALPRTAEERIGIAYTQTAFVRYPIIAAIGQAATSTARLLQQIVSGIGGMLRDLVVQRTVPTDIAGAVGIAVVTHDIVGLGWQYVIQFAAVLSLNLAVINILPIPGLDGGRFFLLLIEGIRRRKFSPRTENHLQQIGVALLLLLIVVVTYRDIVRLAAKNFS